MTPQMNVIHDAARLAMADHRAASPRMTPLSSRGLLAGIIAIGSFLIAATASLIGQLSDPD